MALVLRFERGERVLIGDTMFDIDRDGSRLVAADGTRHTAW